MKKVVKGIAGFLLVAFVVAGCGNKKGDSTIKSTKKESKTEVLTLGVMPATDNIPLIIAHKQGFDHKYGVDLDIKAFKSAKDRDAAFQAGTLDGISTDLVSIALYREAGENIYVTGSTYGEFDVVTDNEKIQSVKDLDGKTVVYSSNTGTEYAMAMILQAAGLSTADVAFKEVPAVPSRLELIENQQVDAGILPEPYVTIGKKDGARVLSSTQKLGINPFSMGFLDKTIQAKDKQIIGMYKAYNEAVSYMKKHDKEDYIDVFIDEIGFPSDLKENIVVPDYPKAQQVSDSDIESVFAWAKEKGILTKNLQPSDVKSDVYFK